MRMFLIWLRSLFPALPVGTIERPSPKIRITPEQADLIIKAIKLIPGYENCFIAALKPSNSMEPGLDDGMYLILENRPAEDLIVGDILWYVHPSFEAIHRITEIGTDAVGWWARCKGDNNDYQDSVKVRPEHLRGVWRGTVN